MITLLAAPIGVATNDYLDDGKFNMSVVQDKITLPLAFTTLITSRPVVKGIFRIMKAEDKYDRFKYIFPLLNICLITLVVMNLKGQYEDYANKLLLKSGDQARSGDEKGAIISTKQSNIARVLGKSIWIKFLPFLLPSLIGLF